MGYFLYLLSPLYIVWSAVRISEGFYDEGLAWMMCGGWSAVAVFLFDKLMRVTNDTTR